MKVRIVGGGTGDLGATRYEIEWLVIKPDVNTEDGIDPDSDTDTYIEYRPEQDAAMRRAQEIFNTTNNLCWKVVTVTKQIVVWLLEEQDCDFFVSIFPHCQKLTDDAYALYRSAQKECEL